MMNREDAKNLKYQYREWNIDCEQQLSHRDYDLIIDQIFDAHEAEIKAKDEMQSNNQNYQGQEPKGTA